MPLNVLENLIDKQDNFEVIRDQIAFILLTEIANQEALAILGGKDPDLYKLQIFLESASPFEQWLNVVDPANEPDLKTWPIINISVDTGNYDRDGSNVISRQQTVSTYNIDCYGLGISADDGGTGQITGDKEAALEAQRAYRLVRNILMAGQNFRLQLDPQLVGVGLRWTNSFTTFQPEIDNKPVQRVVGLRQSFSVTHNEFSQEAAGEIMENVNVEIKRLSDGKVLLERDYPST